MEFLVSLFSGWASKLVGLLIVMAGLLATYFSIKHKGTLEERAKWEKATAEAKIEAQERVLEAVGKDSEIDAKVENEKLRIKEAAKKPPDSDPSSDPDIFNF